MAASDRDIRAAIEARARAARPVGQVTDRRPPRQPIEQPMGGGRATRFVLVSETPP